MHLALDFVMAASSGNIHGNWKGLVEGVCVVGCRWRPAFPVSLLMSPSLGSFNWASLVAQMVKNLSAMCETWVRSLGQEDPQEKGLATRSRILARRIPWTEEHGGPQSLGLQRAGHDWVMLSLFFCL